MAFLKGVHDVTTGRIVFVRNTKGIEFRNNQMDVKDTAGGHRVVTITGIPTGTVELSQGALFVTLDRGSGYVTSSWGGAEDLACRIVVSNSAAQTTSYGGMRGLYVYARQYSGGNMANIYGALITTDDRGTASGGASVGTIQTLTAAQRLNTIVSTKANVLVVECNSQGTITPTTCTGTAMVTIRSTQPIASGARATAIHFETSGSGSGWTNTFSFQTNAGKEGYTTISAGALKGNVVGYCKVYDVAGSRTLYLNLYDTVPS